MKADVFCSHPSLTALLAGPFHLGIKKTFFLSSVWITSKCVSFFNLSLKNEKRCSAENDNLSFESLPNRVSPQDSLCSLYFPAGDGLGFPVLLKCPMNSFSLFRALSWVLCKLPRSASLKRAWFGPEGFSKIKQEGKHLLHLLRNENPSQSQFCASL